MEAEGLDIRCVSKRPNTSSALWLRRWDLKMPYVEADMFRQYCSQITTIHQSNT